MLAYLNGNWIDYASVTVPPWDYGFAMGVSVTEQLRTFNGELFCASWHVDRLLDGLSIIGLESPLARDHLIELATQVVQKNQHDIPPGGDMGVGICITPGGLTKFAPASNQEAQGPTMLAYGYPLNFSGLADRYANGMSLSIVETREIPDACIPRQLKCRSRMHYYLAEQEAAAKQPDSRALLLDLEGNVAEATVATVVIGRDAERDCVKPCAELVLVIIQSNLLPGSGQSFLSNVFCIRNISGQTAFQNRQQPRPISASKLFKRNRAAGSGALSQLV
jgi:branched-subunit amino acid aminotransferase/4-amino-4-deoxychorismate lyase